MMMMMTNDLHPPSDNIIDDSETIHHHHDAEQELEEISHADALQLLFSDEDLTDVSLCGTDGVVVKANRYLLSARSPVFRKMLLGHFAEASAPVVRLGYTGEALRALVEYMCLDQCSILTENNAAAAVDDVTAAGDRAETLAELATAAMYFGLPKLCQRTVNVCLQWMEEDLPSSSIVYCLLWQEFKFRAGEIPSSEAIVERAREFLRKSPESILLGGNNIHLVSLSLLEDIIRDDRMWMSELTRFKVIQKWAEGHPTTTSSDEDNEERESRRQAAKQLTSVIHLECICPSDLSDIVAPSHLVSTEQLLDAYKKQALCAKDMHDVAFERNRFRPIWETSQDAVLEQFSNTWLHSKLHVPTMRSGIHKWSIKVEKQDIDLRLGIALASSETTSWIGGQAHSWSISFDGFAYHDGTGSIIASNHRNFRAGNQITFTLDLRPGNPRNGTLSAAIDDLPAFQVFSNLRSRILVEDPIGEGFVPAASVYRGRVRIIGGPVSASA